MIYSDNTYDITQDISTYTRTDFKSVYDTTRSKWYMLNNLNEYEEYGIYGDSLSATYYTGKLVIVNDEEYEWDGTQWVDLGSYIEVKYPYIQFPNSTSFSNTPYFDTATPLKNTYTVEIKLKTPSSNGSKWRQVLGDYNNWGSFDTLLFALYTNSNNRNFGMNWWNYGMSSRIFADAAFAMAANTIYVIKIQVGTGVTYINDVLQSTSGGNNANGTLSNNLRINTGFTGDPGFNGRIYYVKITEGDTVIANYVATNSNSTPGYVNTVSEIKYTKSGSGSVTYGEDSDTTIPKEYAPKSTPTITSVWPGKLYKNSKYLNKLYRKDTEIAIEKYKDGYIYKKGEIKAVQPSDEIWYTSTNGLTVTPYSTTYLPSIVSNTYTDGKGVIKFATSLTSLGQNAFRNRSTLATITLPNSITSIGDWALGDAKNLKSVILGNNVTHLYTSAFYGSNKIVSIELGNNIQYIGENAFRELYELTRLDLPGTVTYIGANAFYGNSSKLTILNFNNTISAWNSIEKDSNWKTNFRLSVVHCTDGDVNI